MIPGATKAVTQLTETEALLGKTFSEKQTAAFSRPPQFCFVEDFSLAQL
jgi:hypothetical protein